MKVALLTSEQQAKSVNGVEYLDDSFCNPVKDGLGRWVISLEEMQGLGLDLEIVDWVEPRLELELPNLSEDNNENE